MCSDARPRHTDLKAVVQKTKVSLFCCLILWLKKSFLNYFFRIRPRISLFYIIRKRTANRVFVQVFKKLKKFEINCSRRREVPQSMNFFLIIDYLGTYNVEYRRKVSCI